MESRTPENAEGPPPPPHPAPVAEVTAPRRVGRAWRLLFGMVALGAVIGLGVWAWPGIREAFETVSTDDAYVAGHVTYVASRIPGTVLKVHVDDNAFVGRDTPLVELDPEPYTIARARAMAAVTLAEAQVVQARAQGRAIVAGIRGAYNNMKLMMDQVREQVAQLKASAATLKKAEAQVDLAQAEFRRAANLFQSSSGTQQAVDQRRAALLEAEASVNEARQKVRVGRAALGLPDDPSPTGAPVDEVPEGWTKRVPAVRAALAQLIDAGAKIGLSVPPIAEAPDAVYRHFVGQAPGGDLDAYLNQLVEASPALGLARAGLDQARSGLDQAELDLRDTRVRAEIAGFVNRRVVNPGNRVQAGQAMMAIRSLDEVWIDANFKETRLTDLRIGQPVDIRADAYPGRVYRGRVAGFSAGTGASTALLPPENATGNFVKVVQRLSVRIDLVDGNPHDAPLFIGLSAEPRVRIHDPPGGRFAGQKLRLPVERPSTTSATAAAAQSPGMGPVRSSDGTPVPSPAPAARPAP